MIDKKIMASILVITLCAASMIGVTYALTPALTSSGSEVTVDENLSFNMNDGEYTNAIFTENDTKNLFAYTQGGKKNIYYSSTYDSKTGSALPTSADILNATSLNGVCKKVKITTTGFTDWTVKLTTGDLNGWDAYLCSTTSDTAANVINAGDTAAPSESEVTITDGDVYAYVVLVPPTDVTTGSVNFAGVDFTFTLVEPQTTV